MNSISVIIFKIEIISNTRRKFDKSRFQIIGNNFVTLDNEDL